MIPKDVQKLAAEFGRRNFDELDTVFQVVYRAMRNPCPNFKIGKFALLSAAADAMRRNVTLTFELVKHHHTEIWNSEGTFPTHTHMKLNLYIV
jgi:hypothetical protein